MSETIKVFDHEFMKWAVAGESTTMNSPAVPVTGNMAVMSGTLLYAGGIGALEFGMQLEGSYDGKRWMPIAGTLVSMNTLSYSAAASSSGIAFAWVRVNVVILAGRAAFSADVTFSEQ